MKNLAHARITGIILVIAAIGCLAAGCGGGSDAAQRVADQRADHAKLAGDTSTDADATTTPSSDSTSTGGTTSSGAATSSATSTASDPSTSTGEPTTPSTAAGSGTAPSDAHATYQAKLDALTRAAESGISAMLQAEIATTSGGAVDTTTMSRKSDALKGAADDLAAPPVPTDAQAGNAQLVRGMRGMADFLARAARQLSSVPDGQELQAVLSLTTELQQSSAFADVDAGEKALNAAGYRTGDSAGSDLDLGTLLQQAQAAAK